VKRAGPSRLSLKGRALQLLAQREHSRLELRRKLLPYAALDGAAEAGAPGSRPEAAMRRAPQQPADEQGRRRDRGAGDVSPSASASADTSDARSRAAAPSFERSSERRGAVTFEVAAQVDALLDWLESNAYLSDARFVESRLRARASRLGTLRIRQELARHGTELSPEAVQVLKTGEAARAAAVWQRKFGEPAADAAGRARQMRFLAARGFDAEVVRRVVPAPCRREDAEAADD
jgi:regulatory protein